MIRLTASGLARAEACPASGHLPQRREEHADAAAGTEAHARHEAETPAGYEAEVPFALNVLTGEARRLPPQEHREYPDLGAGWVYGTVDRIGVLNVAEGRAAIMVDVRDYKSGFGYQVAPAESNIQLGFGAVAAATVHAAESARVGIDGDEGTRSEHTLDSLALLAMEQRIRRVYEGVEASAAVEPIVVEGEHCWRCPCAWRCPAKRDVATALASADPQLPTLELTPEAVAAGWERLKKIRQVLNDVDRIYRGYASTTPVPLANGKTLGEVESTRESVDGATAFLALAEAHGHEVAMAACEFKASKASIERAVKPLAEKGKGAALVRETLQKIAAKGGITTKTTRSVEEH